MASANDEKIAAVLSKHATVVARTKFSIKDGKVGFPTPIHSTDFLNIQRNLKREPSTSLGTNGMV